MSRELDRNPPDGGKQWAANSTPTILLVLAGLVVATSPFDEIVRFNVPFVRNPSAFLGLVFLALFVWTSRGRFVLTSVSQVWALAFVAIVGIQELSRLALAGALGASYVGSPSLTLVGALYMAWVQPVVLFLLISTIARDGRSVGFILNGLPIVMSLLGLGAIVVAGSGRWAPIGLNENFAGGAFGMSIVIATSRLLRTLPREAPGWTIAFAVSVPVAMVGLLVSGSRGASAATLVALCVLVSSGPIKFRRLIILGIAAFALVLASGPFFLSASEVLVGRWSQTLDGSSFGSRDALLSISAGLVLESPIWGYGLQANHAVGERWFGEPGSPFSSHNTYLALLVSFGVVGALPWFGMVAAAGLQTWRYRRSPSGALLLSLLSFFAVNMVTGDLSGNKLFYVILGLSACLPFWSMDPGSGRRAQPKARLDPDHVRARDPDRERRHGRARVGRPNGSWPE